MREERRALVPVLLAERGRDQEGNLEVLVGALVARGIDSMLLLLSWLGLLVSLLLRGAVARHVTLLLATEASALLHQTIDITGLESRDAVSTLVAGIRRRWLGGESGQALLHRLELGEQQRLNTRS